MGAAVAVVDQPPLGRLASVQRLFEGVEDEAGLGAARDAPSDDAAREDVDERAVEAPSVRARWRAATYENPAQVAT